MDELNQPNSPLNTKIESFYARVMKTYFFRNKNLHTYLPNCEWKNYCTFLQIFSVLRNSHERTGIFDSF